MMVRVMMVMSSLMHMHVMTGQQKWLLTMVMMRMLLLMRILLTLRFTEMHNSLVHGPHDLA